MPKNTERLQIQPYVYASVFSSALIILSAIWDISWHSTVGRDGFFSLPHFGIYIGSVVCAAYSGYRIIYYSFFGPAEERTKRVKIWWVFYALIGELFSVWGAIAMLTSAPFDNWWHNVFGVDLFILSPPHTLVLVGMTMIQSGVMLTIISESKTVNARSKFWYQRIFVLSTGLIVATLYTLFSDILNKAFSHSLILYLVSAVIFPLPLIAVRQASALRWAATGAAAVYMAAVLIIDWFVPLFPATPLLGPILTPMDHFQPFYFPFLLVVPALFIDLISFRSNTAQNLRTAIIASVAFLLVFFAVQWPFGAFLHTSVYARNWFFGSYGWYFNVEPDYKYRFAFNPTFTDTGFILFGGMLLACIIAALSGAIGYKFGEWMKKVQR